MMYRHKKMTKGMDAIYIYKYDGDDFMAEGPMYEALIGTRDLIPLHRHRDYPSQFQRNQSTTI